MDTEVTGVHTAEPSKSERLKVFISYSRQDSGFVDRLQSALRECGIKPHVDLDDIEKGEDVWSGIEYLITISDTIVFVLSPDSVDSEACLYEVDYAESLQKRFIPIVARDLAGCSVPNALADLNRIFFIETEQDRASGDFDEAFEQLVSALEKDIAWIRAHTRLGEAAKDWDRAGRPAYKLLRGGDIANALKWMNSRPAKAPEPGKLRRDFVDASKRAARRRRIALISVAAIVFIGTVVGAIAFYFQRKILELQSENTWTQESHRLARLADEQTLKGDAVSGMLISLEALPDPRRGNKRPFVGSAESSLIQGWQIRRESLVLGGHRDDVSIARFGPQDQHVVTGSWDGTAKLWDAQTGALLHRLIGHGSAITAVAFAPDGHSVATADSSGVINSWDVATGQLTHRLEGHVARVRMLDFSADSRLLISGSYDRSVRVWRLESGRSVAALSNRSERVLDVRSRPGGAIALVASSDGIIRVRHVSNGRVLKEVRTFAEGRLRQARLGPAMDRIALVTDDGRLQLWDADTGRVLAEEGEASHGLYIVKFSLDGRWLVFAENRNIKVFDARTGDRVAKLEGPRNEIIRDFAISPDGKKIAIGSKTFFIWDRESGGKLDSISGIGRVARLRGHLSFVRYLEFSSDGNRLVSASSDKTARIWDVVSSTRIQTWMTSGSNTPVAFTVSIRGSRHQSKHIEGKDQFFDYARRSVPRCLTGEQRAELLITREPPRWCIELAKWPYDSSAWRAWLEARDRGENPALP